jgi:hypothetical protein
MITLQTRKTDERASVEFPRSSTAGTLLAIKYLSGYNPHQG